MCVNIPMLCQCSDGTAKTCVATWNNSGWTKKGDLCDHAIQYIVQLQQLGDWEEFPGIMCANQQIFNPELFKFNCCCPVFSLADAFPHSLYSWLLIVQKFTSGYIYMVSGKLVPTSNFICSFHCCPIQSDYTRVTRMAYVLFRCFPLQAFWQRTMWVHPHNWQSLNQNFCLECAEICPRKLHLLIEVPVICRAFLQCPNLGEKPPVNLQQKGPTTSDIGSC